MKNISTTSDSLKAPHALLAYRTVKHFYKPVVHVNTCSANVTSSLSYQMEASIKDLMQELKEGGKDYELLLIKDNVEAWRRWNLYVNGDIFATIDADYGFDCFDTSATHFKDTIATLIELSDVSPLSELERMVLNSQRKAARILQPQNESS